MGVLYVWPAWRGRRRTGGTRWEAGGVDPANCTRQLKTARIVFIFWVASFSSNWMRREPDSPPHDGVLQGGNVFGRCSASRSSPPVNRPDRGQRGSGQGATWFLSLPTTENIRLKPEYGWSGIYRDLATSGAIHESTPAMTPLAPRAP